MESIKKRPKHGRPGAPPDRPRGGASAPCPECGANSEVVRTKRRDSEVTRLRRCVAGHEFTTSERPT